MKQKYLISKDDAKKELIIREFAELDKDAFSLLCEEVFEEKIIKSAMSRGKEALVSALRTKNMYPIGAYAEKIAEGVTALYTSKESDSIELFFDDIEILTKEREALKLLEAGEDASVEIDTLLEDDDSEETFDDNDISSISYPIKIADDDSASSDDEE